MRRDIPLLQGYPSIGCACSRCARAKTARRTLAQPEEECGIHILDGGIVRSPATRAEPTGQTR